MKRFARQNSRLSLMVVLIVIALGIAPVSLFGIQTHAAARRSRHESVTWNR